MFKLEPWQSTLWIMFTAQLASAIGFSIIFPFLPLYVADLGSSHNLSIEFLAGMVFSAQAITMMIASPFWGAIADRYGRKLMVERAMFGGTIIVGLMAFVGSAEELVLLRAIQGLITGTVSAANALVAASAPRKNMGYAMAVIQVALWGGVSIGPMIGGVLADLYGYAMPFLITAGLLFVSGILVHFGIHEEFSAEQKTNNKQQGFVAEWRHILGMPGVIQTYAIRFLAGLSRSMLVPITPLFVAALLAGNVVPLPLPDFLGDLSVQTGGVSTITGLVVGMASATATVSAIYLGRLGDRIGHRTILLVSAVCAAIGFLPQAFVTEAWQLFVLQALAGLAVGGIVAAPSALLAHYTEPGEEGAVYGLDNSVVAGARAAAPLVGASIAAWIGLRAAFASVAVLFGVMILVVLALLPRHQPTSTAAVVEVEKLPA